jgi:hypothetical protein
LRVWDQPIGISKQLNLDFDVSEQQNKVDSIAGKQGQIGRQPYLKKKIVDDYFAEMIILTISTI